MASDAIDDELLRVKRALAALHGNDVRRIADDARARQSRAVTRPPRPCRAEPNVAPAPPVPLAPDGPAAAAAE